MWEMIYLISMVFVILLGVIVFFFVFWEMGGDIYFVSLIEEVNLLFMVFLALVMIVVFVVGFFIDFIEIIFIIVLVVVFIFV